MRILAFGSQPSVERLDKGVVGRFAWPLTVERDAALIGPQIHVARDELGALVDTDLLRIADLAANAIQCRNHIFAAMEQPPERGHQLG